jgi:hypothetical protein
LFHKLLAFLAFLLYEEGQVRRREVLLLKKPHQQFH